MFDGDAKAPGVDKAASKTGEAGVVDARGLRCPMPVLRLARAMRLDPDQNRFLLIADDPAAETDVPAFASERGWICRTKEPGQFLLTRD